MKHDIKISHAMDYILRETGCMLTQRTKEYLFQAIEYADIDNFTVDGSDYKSELFRIKSKYYFERKMAGLNPSRINYLRDNENRQLALLRQKHNFA